MRINEKHNKRLIALLPVWMAVTSISAQELKNADFNAIDGWKIEGGKATIENGKLHIYAGENTKVSQKTKVEQGSYVIKTEVQSSASNGTCFVFGQGEGFTQASTAIPQSGFSPTNVIVKGVQSEDGLLEVGFENDGSHDLFIDKILIAREQKAYSFGQGGDITELNYVLANGGNYYDEKGEPLYHPNDPMEEKARNVIRFLRKKGMDLVRIRLSNLPGKSQPDNSNTYFLPEGFQDEKDCLLLAELAHEEGMKIQFTFNYSDYWSNGERQNIPADWKQEIQWMNDRNAIVQKLTQLLGDYTRRIMKELAQREIYPEYVSLGNEINGGLLFPYGYSYDVKAQYATQDMPEGYANWDAISKFINAGYDAVKAVSPQSKVVIHLADQTGDFRKHGNTVDYYTYAWFFSTLEKNGGKYDVIGASYYPSWSQSTVNDMVGYCNNLIRKFHKDILVMESGYNWNKTRKDGYEGQLNQNAEEYETKYPDSPAGQKGYLTELINGLKNVGEGTDNQCVGVLYWDPVMIHVEDEWGKNKTGWAHWVQWDTPDVNVVENTTLFDFDGKALPALDAFYQNKTSHKAEPTDPMLLSDNKKSQLSIISTQGGITIQAHQKETVAIFRLNGEGKFFHMTNGEQRLIHLPAGAYVVNGEMVVVR